MWSSYRQEWSVSVDVRASKQLPEDVFTGYPI